jgi:putative two-component system response regulator
MEDWDIDLVMRSSRLHDVGKITIGEKLLLKPGKLTNEEFENMKKHTIFGEQIIDTIMAETAESDFLKYARIFAGTHQEKWDGTGYPNGLRGEEIPLQGRLMAIADVYDNLTSARPYKQAFTHDEAVRTIIEGSGTHFEPALVRIFEKSSEQFKKIKGQRDFEFTKFFEELRDSTGQ